MFRRITEKSTQDFIKEMFRLINQKEQIVALEEPKNRLAHWVRSSQIPKSGVSVLSPISFDYDINNYILRLIAQRPNFETLLNQVMSFSVWRCSLGRPNEDQEVLLNEIGAVLYKHAGALAGRYASWEEAYDDAKLRPFPVAEVIADAKAADRNEKVAVGATVASVALVGIVALVKRFGLLSIGEEKKSQSAPFHVPKH